MIKAVIFDLDGTLLDRDRSVRLFIEEQYERLKTKLSHILKETYVHRFIELDNRGYVWKDIVYKQMVEDFSIELSSEAMLEDYVQEFKQHCVPFENLHSMLHILKKQGLKLGMITNGYGQFQLDNIRALRIEEDFDVILISECEGIKKPNAEIFHRALSKLGVFANESMYIGDHPFNDVEAAKKVGMMAIWKRNDAWQKVEADYNIDNLIEIQDILKVLQKT
ncbi:HAD-IIIA family hydrolase [Lysinibacillus agricola]|uniref:HAD-IIIA family hydrolase n=1 Tax=Lysinibacillus agricola TaxID=2590012 RepID=A0ABX7AXM3_9BACI|nr:MULTISPECIES: HAD-IIIA family hydrolase [Lysinibacillus]KOS60181.1 L-2-haloalkanoic acid dehalogenase [Lysinibacillus sp. FJAT-14222]QQP14470.1 HAD-IIIA family hydrolase [Lysinibacillus agricola]